MATSSGNSTTMFQNSSSEEDLQVLMDQRKRKRMQSNRESARRSRLRKQQHLDELMGQVTKLRSDNNQILTTINITTQHCLSIEAENSIMRAQMIELTQRLESLNEILNYINSRSNEGFQTDCFMINPMNFAPFHQLPPIMASPDIFN